MKKSRFTEEQIGYALRQAECGTPVVDVCSVNHGLSRPRCLNVNQFVSIDDARKKIEAWQIDYNQHPPMAHSGT